VPLIYEVEPQPLPSPTRTLARWLVPLAAAALAAFLLWRPALPGGADEAVEPPAPPNLAAERLAAERLQRQSPVSLLPSSSSSAGAGQAAGAAAGAPIKVTHLPIPKLRKPAGPDYGALVRRIGDPRLTAAKLKALDRAARITHVPLPALAGISKIEEGHDTIKHDLCNYKVSSAGVLYSAFNINPRRWATESKLYSPKVGHKLKRCSYADAAVAAGGTVKYWTGVLGSLDAALRKYSGGGYGTDRATADFDILANIHTRR
jgi:hypothetical protein